MSSKGAKASKAVDKGDGHWSGVGKGEKFTVTFQKTDTVGSNTTLPTSFSLSISLWFTHWYTQSHPNKVGRVLVGIGRIGISMTLI